MRVQTRRSRSNRVLIPVIAATMAAATAAETPSSTQQTPTFKAATELITTEVRVWDKDRKFIPGLTAKDFQIFEDGVPQTVQTFSTTIGSRTIGQPRLTLPAASGGGIILPPTAPASDASGRIFIIFIDDLHLQAIDTPRVRQWLRDIRDTLVHDNDLVGFVSSGYSSIQGEVGYDYQHRRFNAVIDKVMGGAATPNQIVTASTTSSGPSGLNHNVHVAFATVYDLLNQFARITDRTKAIIYVSSGYDLNPFKDSRYREEQAKYSTTPQGVGGAPPGLELNDPRYTNPFERSGQFLESQLIAQMAELVNTARRTNTTFYTMDPRGLVPAIPDINQNISTQEHLLNTRTQIATLMVLADETNGICICNMNDPKPMLRQIDNAMSDYYLIGYVSTNPDPLHLRRKIEIRIERSDVREIQYLKDYTLPRPRK